MPGILIGVGTIKANGIITSLPVPVSAEITNADRDEVVITFDIALDPASVPDVSAFTLVGKTISNVTVAGSSVTLTVTVAYAYGDAPVVDYVKPAINMIRGLVTGDEAASFTAQSITNNIKDPYFKITIDTTKAGSANDTFILPTVGSGTYNYYIDWGEGGGEDHVTVNTSQTHVYAASGTYQIKIRGTFPRIYFNNTGDRAKLIYIDHWGDIVWSNMGNAFYGCVNMNGRYDDIPDLSAVTYANSMFQGCTIFNYPVPFVTPALVNVVSMFASCPAFNQPISFYTGSVTSFTSFLNGASAFKQSLADLRIDSATAMDWLVGDINIGLSTFNYDTTLISWASQVQTNNVPLRLTGSKYSVAGGGKAARDILTGAPYNWIITDGGQID